MVNIQIVYSRLCDVDPGAYNSYLSLVRQSVADVAGSGGVVGAIAYESICGVAGGDRSVAGDGLSRVIVSAEQGVGCDVEFSCAGGGAVGGQVAGFAFRGCSGSGGIGVARDVADVSGRVVGADDSGCERQDIGGVTDAEVAIENVERSGEVFRDGTDGVVGSLVGVRGVNWERGCVQNVVRENPVVAVGSNYERNKKNREAKKDRKKKRQAMGQDWRKTRGRAGNVDVVGSAVVDRGSGGVGFWNSCSASVRQELIDSKARMHIADNKRRAEEAEQRVKRLQSPEQILRDAMRMVDFANEQAKKQNDAKIYGWAKTVAETYAETIAKSAPTSVESFESYIKSDSSVVSLEAFNEVVKIKDALQLECNELKKRVTAVQESPSKLVGGVVDSGASSCVKRDLPVSKPVLSQAHFLQVTAQKVKAANASVGVDATVGTAVDFRHGASDKGKSFTRDDVARAFMQMNAPKVGKHRVPLMARNEWMIN